MTETAPVAPVPQPPGDVTAVVINAIVGLIPRDNGPTAIGIGFDVSGLFSVTSTLTPDAADTLAAELRQAARVAREQSPGIATPIKKIIIPGR